MAQNYTIFDIFLLFKVGKDMILKLWEYFCLRAKYIEKTIEFWLRLDRNLLPSWII